MVEHHYDKTNECGRTIINKEIFLWEATKNFLNVIEHSRSPYNLLFPWDNCRMDGNKVLSLLDWKYFPLGSTFNPQYLPILYVMKGDNSLLDHLLVSIIIQLHEVEKKNSLENEYKVLKWSRKTHTTYLANHTYVYNFFASYAKLLGSIKNFVNVKRHNSGAKKGMYI